MFSHREKFLRFRRIHLFQAAILVVAVLAWMVTTGKLNAASLTEEVANRIGQRIMASPGKALLNFSYNDADTAQLIRNFYLQRNNLPAWSGEEGPGPQAAELLRILKRANREGLSPQDYGILRLEALMAEIALDREGGSSLNPEELTDLDLLLTEAFFSYAAHFSGGRADHQRQYPGWVYKRRQTDLAKTLQKALENNDLEITLNGLAPRFYGYTKLREKLNEYIDIAEAGGWPTIPAGRTLKQGMRDPRVSLLRKRLMMTTPTLDSPREKQDKVFDRNLEAAVRQFQKQQGQKQDGIVGPATLRALNLPVEVRVCQMAVNLDRLRWLPTELGNRYLLINIPDFNLAVVEDSQAVMNIRAIVGKTDKRTNLLSSRVTSVELNPYWRVPKSIAVDEYLPKLKRNPQYLSGKKIKVFSGDYQTNPVSPTSVKWSRLSADYFPYFLRQEPGPDNPLGRIKFVFSNSADIYIHDTPTRDLFARSKRTFSHGCIRIEKPVDLAVYLLQGLQNDAWSNRSIQAELRKGKNRSLTLPRPIPVHIVYKTVWTDQEGNLNFRPDIYDIDNIPGNLLIMTASSGSSRNHSTPR